MSSNVNKRKSWFELALALPFTMISWSKFQIFSECFQVLLKTLWWATSGPQSVNCPL